MRSTTRDVVPDLAIRPMPLYRAFDLYVQPGLNLYITYLPLARRSGGGPSATGGRGRAVAMDVLLSMTGMPVRPGGCAKAGREDPALVDSRLELAG